MSDSKKSVTDLPPDDRPQGRQYTGVSVNFFCHDGAGRFVMARRSLKARDEQGRWDTGGGGLDFGASVEETLRSEILEEYGAQSGAIEFLGFRDVHRRPGGVPTHWIALDYKVQVDPAQVRNCEPHKFDEIGWFTLESLPPADELHSQLPFFFETYRKQLV